MVREALKGLGAEQVVLDWRDEPEAALERIVRLYNAWGRPGRAEAWRGMGR